MYCIGADRDLSTKRLSVLVQDDGHLQVEAGLVEAIFVVAFSASTNTTAIEFAWCVHL